MTQTRTSSVARFKAMTTELQREIRSQAVADLNEAAVELANQMRALAPLGRTGNLRKSIRVQPGKKDTRVRILAGGPLTTIAEVRKGSGVKFDYSRAVEFGTRTSRAKPFFWPSWRLRKKRIRSKLKSRITRSVKKRSAA
jgi:HK97 gp10 family phage protein